MISSVGEREGDDADRARTACQDVQQVRLGEEHVARERQARRTARRRRHDDGVVAQQDADRAISARPRRHACAASRSPCYAVVTVSCSRACPRPLGVGVDRAERGAHDDRPRRPRPRRISADDPAPRARRACGGRGPAPPRARSRSAAPPCPSAASSMDQLVDRPLGADVDAPGRLVGDAARCGVRQQPLGQRRPSAGCRPTATDTGIVWRGGTGVDARQRLADDRALAARGSARRAGVTSSMWAIVDVLVDASASSPGPGPCGSRAASRGRAGCAPCGDASDRTSPPSISIVPACGWIGAEDRAGDLACGRCPPARRARRSPRADVEARRRRSAARRVRPSDPQHRRRVRGRTGAAAGTATSSVRPEHRRDQARPCVSSAAGDVLHVAARPSAP